MTDESLAVQRAVFGDVRGAHNLIVSSAGANSSLLSDLASRYTDRLLPAELSWQEYSCGFPLREHYVVTRTFPVRATRAGMVQTHALMVPIANVDDYSLSNLLALLPLEPTTSLTSLDAVDTTLLTEANNANPMDMPPGYPSVARALLQGQVPVWVGQEGFESIVCFLWQRLWPKARRRLRFRVSAEPNDLADSPATLVWTPKALRGNWNDKHFVNQADAMLDNPSQSEAYLMSMVGGDALANLLNSLQMPPTSITGLKRLEQYVTMSEGETADSIRAAIRLLGAIAPGADELQFEKKSLLDRLAQKTAEGSEEDILALRNLDVTGIEAGVITLQKAIADWLRLRVNESRNATMFAREVLLANHSWKATALSALMQEFNAWTPGHAALLWHWWTADSALVMASEPLIPSTDRVESDFVATMPSVVQKELWEAALSFAVTQSWFSLHGAVLSVASDMTPIEKLKRQLAVEPELGDQAGLRLLISKVGDVNLVEAAVALQNGRLADLAGRAAARSPSLLANIDATNSTWLTVWSKSIEYGGQPFNGFVEPALTAHIVMDSFVSGSNIPQELVERLAVESDSDLAGYEKRASLWSLLSNAVCGHAIRTTARTWLTRFLADSRYDPNPLESELERCVIETWRSVPEIATPGSVFELWARFSGLLAEQDFLHWLETYLKPFTNIEALAIGSLVKKHGWREAAGSLIRLFKHGRSDVGPAVNECVSLLGFWDKAYFSIWSTPTVITYDEWLSAWVDHSSSLYPLGVRDNNIWADAAGDISRVKQGTGREEWGYALDLLRKGGAGGTMTIEGLLHEMRKDFPANSNLEILEIIYLKRLRPLSA